jgi:hypothetical protein
MDMERFTSLSEAEKTQRVLRVVQSPQWDFLTSLQSIDGCAFKTPVVRELPRPRPSDEPDYDPPNEDALAA